MLQRKQQETPRTKAAPGKLRCLVRCVSRTVPNPRLQAAVGVSMLVAGIYIGCALDFGTFHGAG